MNFMLFNHAQCMANIQIAWQKYQEGIALLKSLKADEQPAYEYMSSIQNILNKFALNFLAPQLGMQNINAALSPTILSEYFELFSKVSTGHKSGGSDRRFRDEAWSINPFLTAIKDYYENASKLLSEFAQNMGTLTPHERHQLEFYTKQIVDAMSPSNFIMTNPEVIREIINTNGASLVNGAENFLKDIQLYGENFRISSVDVNAFKVGETLAVTKGKVVYQNSLMQLIQYDAQTKEVFQTPILICTAWINKYYILDLKQENSFIKWLVDQGHTVFLISWINPGSNLADKGFADYLSEGVLESISKVQELTKEKEINCIGYCLGGTLIASALGYLAAQDNKSIKSATFLTTLIDFTECGDIGVFIDEPQINHLTKIMEKKGFLDGNTMYLTFSWLKANDMIWSQYINNYLLGKNPGAFDIAYWNSDSTRLTIKMHEYYLKNMYLYNNLIQSNKMTLLGTPIDLHRINIPTYIFATKGDHIAPWKSTYIATQVYKGKNRFVLSDSGHVVGTINHPNKNKYCYWVNEILPHNPVDWLENAKEMQGSWWLDWIKWICEYGGAKVPSRKVLNAIEDAPGSYVKG